MAIETIRPSIKYCPMSLQSGRIRTAPLLTLRMMAIPYPISTNMPKKGTRVIAAPMSNFLTHSSSSKTNVIALPRSISLLLVWFVAPATAGRGIPIKCR